MRRWAYNTFASCGVTQSSNECTSKGPGCKWVVGESFLFIGQCHTRSNNPQSTSETVYRVYCLVGAINGDILFTQECGAANLSTLFETLITFALRNCLFNRSFIAFQEACAACIECQRALYISNVNRFCKSGRIGNHKLWDARGQEPAQMGWSDAVVALPAQAAFAMHPNPLGLQSLDEFSLVSPKDPEHGVGLLLLVKLHPTKINGLYESAAAPQR